MAFGFWRISGIFCIIGGTISNILGIMSYVSELKTLEYLQTRPPGSNIPVITFDVVWYYIGIGISLIVIGVLVLLKYKKFSIYDGNLES